MIYLVFERSHGRFRSNCNILSLAWTPYYNETKFREALLEYHQCQLLNLTTPRDPFRNPLDSAVQANAPFGPNNFTQNLSAVHQNQAAQLRPIGVPEQRPTSDINNSNSNNNNSLSQVHEDQVQYLNSRVAELCNRIRLNLFPMLLFMNRQQRQQRIQRFHNDTDFKCYAQAERELDKKFGKFHDFGWLVIGNIGRVTGVCLTSTANTEPEVDIILQESMLKLNESSAKRNDDLIVLKDEETDELNDPMVAQVNGTETSPCSEYEQLRPDRSSMRTNYNLRGHLDEIILVKWNELYQKFATVDSRGNVLIWCKINEKFTIQTPFYNRSRSVADFEWSNDGKTALICYTDSFILVGSSSSQRHWHSMLNLDDYHITCASWTPNDEQILLGVSNGNIVIIDLQSSDLTELSMNHRHVRAMSWSTSKINIKHLVQDQGPGTTSNHDNDLNDQDIENLDSTRASCQDDLYHADRFQTRENSTVVNHRRLGKDCSVFSRYRLCSQGPTSSNQSRLNRFPHDDQQQEQNSRTSTKIRNILAIDFADNTIKLFENSLSDRNAKSIKVEDLVSYTLNWSQDGKILAVAGFCINMEHTPMYHNFENYQYENFILFYDQEANLIHRHRLDYGRYPLTAFTWAHDDKRIFVATGPRLHCAKVFTGKDCSLNLMAAASLQRNINLPDKIDVMENILAGFSQPLVRFWQSFNCPIDLIKETKRFSQIQRNISDSSSSDHTTSSTSSCAGYYDSSQRNTVNDKFIRNNSNLHQLELPHKLKLKVDELFAQTIKPPFDEHLLSNDIIWHVPKDKRRFNCTLVCFKHENPSLRQSTLNYGGERQYESHSSEQYRTFILFVEHLGSITPILRARRVGVVKPEFVIFDPDDNPVDRATNQRLCKVSDIVDQISEPSQGPSSSTPSKRVNYKRSDENVRTDRIVERIFQRADKPMDNCIDLHEHCGISKSFKPPRDNQQSFRNGLDQCYKSDSMKGRKQFKHILAQEMGKKSGGRDLIKLIEDHIERILPKSRPNRDILLDLRCLHYRIQSDRNYNYTLGVKNELVRIKSNVWGTKFKVINVGNRVIKERSNLCTVTYKASILHLQPRQILLKMKDMSNYCCLCSRHHHSKRKSLVKEDENLSTKNQKTSNKINLIDAELPIVPTIKTKSSAHHQRKSHSAKSSPKKKQTDRCDDNKIVVAVGDSIRIAPKLDDNQRYRFVGFSRTSSRSNNPTPSTSKASNFAPPNIPNRSAVEFSSRSRSAQSPTSLEGRAASSSKIDDIPDDILTLSLEDNKTKIRMISSSSSLDRTKRSGDNIESFLESNKTLKSIQTITKMIVDLSAKAENDDIIDDCTDKGSPRDKWNGSIDKEGEETDELSSPKKLFKLSIECDADSSSAGKNSHAILVPPETPVHKPKHRTAAAIRATESRLSRSKDPIVYLAQTQSATTTPMKMHGPRHRPRRGHVERTTSLSIASANEQSKHNQQQQKPIPLGRKISSSAKRLLDGSLRSLTNVGASGNSSSDLECEDCEPLVQRRSSRSRHRHHSQVPGDGSPNRFWFSQPASPMRHLETTLAASERIADSRERLGTIRDQLIEKIRNGSKRASSMSRTQSVPKNQRGLTMLTNSGTQVKRFLTPLRRFASSLNDDSIRYRDRYEESKNRNDEGDDDNEDDDSYDDDDDDNNDGDEEEDGDDDSDEDDDEFEYMDQELSSGSKVNTLADRPAKFHGRKLSASSQDLSHRVRTKKTGEDRIAIKKRSKLSRRPICSRSHCCCAKELKLTNRAPVWNEQSQVYQLDFGGRVTQESAKNLQIDYNGDLALQFGRIDKRSYTLDYGYPFNAVQAMSIALASLTQRLK